MIDDPQFAKDLLERLGQAATIVVDSKGNIVYTSKRAERLLGVNSKKVSGESFFDTVTLLNDKKEILPERKNPVWQALQQPDHNQMTPFFCKLARGEEEPVSVAVRALQICKGKKITGAVVEIREIKRILNVGEMKSLFVSFAAHQLKTPSSIVKGFLELMMQGGPKSYQADQWYNLQSAYEANERLISLSKTLLNLTRLEGGLIEPKVAEFNPHNVLKQKINAHKPMLALKEVKAKVVKTGRSNSFPSDELFFSEICDIFISNALKHAPANSIITATCRVDANELRVEVKDQGPGVSEEMQATLFNTASDISPQDNSHGLGLLMAKKYVSLLGGTIGLLPEAKRGAIFFFTIPKPIS